MGLTTEEIKEVSDVLVEAMDVTIEALPREHKAKILTLTLALIHTEKPIRLFSVDGMDRLAYLAFDDPEVLDFWQTLEIQFFARWGRAKERYVDLADTLAYAIGLQTSSKAFAMPTPIADRLPLYSTLQEFFSENTWALIMACLMVYLKMPTFLARLTRMSKNPGETQAQ
jgi:hypothetical protein